MGARLRTRAQRKLGKRPRTLKTRELVADVRRQAEPLFDWAAQHQGWGEAPTPARPKTRGECEPCATCQAFIDSGAPAEANRLACGHRVAEAFNHCRPCARLSCRYHLAIDVKEEGHLRMNFPDKALEDLAETCALDAADKGHHSREQVGDLLNVTGQRVTQIEQRLRRVIGLRVMGQDYEDQEDGDA